MTNQPELFAVPEPQQCEHELVLTLTPELVHYGREDCVKCKKFIRWVPYSADAIRKSPQ